MKKPALPPLPTSVFHRNNRKVNRDQVVMDAAAFFDRVDAGGRRVQIKTAYGQTKRTNLRFRR